MEKKEFIFVKAIFSYFFTICYVIINITQIKE